MKLIKSILLVFFSLIFLNILAAEPIKLAIICDTQDNTALIDIITSKLVKDQNISLYDRNVIDKILQEHKLQAAGMTSDTVILIRNILHVDYIACISSSYGPDKKTIPSGIILFDAKNGYRLLNKALPSDLEKAADFSAEKIKTALSSLNEKKKKFASVRAVRNFGAGNCYDPILTQIVLRTEQLIGDSPNIAILERNKLAIVNDERNISLDIYKLEPTALMIDFELSLDSAGQNPILTVYTRTHLKSQYFLLL